MGTCDKDIVCVTINYQVETFIALPIVHKPKLCKPQLSLTDMHLHRMCAQISLRKFGHM